MGLATVAALSVFRAHADELIRIDDIKFQVYDARTSALLESLQDPYASDSELVVAVKLTNTQVSSGQYLIKLTAFGAGRENEAEGLVEDYRVEQEVQVTLSGESSRYFPLLLDYPCTDNVDFSIEVWQGQHRLASQQTQAMTGCVLY